MRSDPNPDGPKLGERWRSRKTGEVVEVTRDDHLAIRTVVAAPVDAPLECFPDDYERVSFDLRLASEEQDG